MPNQFYDSEFLHDIVSASGHYTIPRHIISHSRTGASCAYDIISFRQRGGNCPHTIDIPCEIEMYHRIRSESLSDPHSGWGRDHRALIFSDRCAGRALGLCEYLLRVTDLEVEMLSASKHIEKVMQLFQPDIVILVGYLEDKEGYRLLKSEESSLLMMYAHVDHVIRDECAKYGIGQMFHCMEPMADLIRILKDTL